MSGVAQKLIGLSYSNHKTDAGTKHACKTACQVARSLTGAVSKMLSDSGHLCAVADKQTAWLAGFVKTFCDQTSKSVPTATTDTEEPRLLRLLSEHALTDTGGTADGWLEDTYLHACKLQTDRLNFLPSLLSLAEEADSASSNHEQQSRITSRSVSVTYDAFLPVSPVS